MIKIPHIPYALLFTTALIGIAFPDFVARYEIPGLLIACPLATWAILKSDVRTLT